MKYCDAARPGNYRRSHPARGAWIEILHDAHMGNAEHRSHPARGAWIEIFLACSKVIHSPVAPRKGCVD